jgi:hypothetical protein
MFYSLDTIVSGGLDVSDRFQLEPTSLPQDTITLEADDGGKLNGFPAYDNVKYTVRAGQIFSSSIENKTVPVTGSQFASLAGSLLSSSLDNFKKLYILQSPDPVDNKEREFIVGPKSKEFVITNDNPIGPDGAGEQRRERDVERVASLTEETGGLVRFCVTLRREIHVGPAGKTIFEIPLAFAVTHQYKFIHGRHRLKCG